MVLSPSRMSKRAEPGSSDHACTNPPSGACVTRTITLLRERCCARTPALVSVSMSSIAYLCAMPAFHGMTHLTVPAAGASAVSAARDAKGSAQTSAAANRRRDDITISPGAGKARRRDCTGRPASGLGGGLRRQHVVVADHAGELPGVALLLPQVDELAGLGELVRFAGMQGIEAMRAHLHGAVVVEHVHCHRPFDEFAARAEIRAV